MLEKAEYIAIWSGEEVFCCKDHAGQLRALGSALGINVPVYGNAKKPDAVCVNCKNEEAKK